MQHPTPNRFLGIFLLRFPFFLTFSTAIVDNSKIFQVPYFFKPIPRPLIYSVRAKSSLFFPNFFGFSYIFLIWLS